VDGMLRIGRVSDIDSDNRKVRVRFEDVGSVSGWLKVLQSPPSIPKPGGIQRTENTAGGTGENAFAEHSHELKITSWLPNISDIVLCIYDPVFNGDGYVLGAL